MKILYPLLLTTNFLNRRILALLSAFILLTHIALADNSLHMIPFTLQERLQASEIVIEGEVVSKKSFWDARRELIYTSNIIKVYKVFKGDVRGNQQIELITQGGTVDLDKHVWSAALELKTGQQGTFFLNRQQRISNTPSGARISTMVYGSQQGFIKYDLQDRTAKSVFDTYTSVDELYNQITKTTGTNYKTITENTILAQPVQQPRTENITTPSAIISFTPKVASAGTKTVLTINGTGFGSSRGSGYVSFRDADAGGTTFMRPAPDAYVSWTNTQIKLYIPSAGQGENDGVAGTGEIRVTTTDGTTFSSVEKLTIEFAYSNIIEEGKTYQPKLINADNNGGYTIQFAPSMQSRAAAQEGFRRAMNSWICNTGVNWKIGAPISKETSVADGQVIIRFAPQSEVGERILASTLSQYRGCRLTSTGELAWWLSEFDMAINSNITWQYGPGPPQSREYDFETVMLHELGHAHQLGHVILPNIAVMHYSLEFERAYRDLSEADIRGGNFVMANSQIPDFCEKPRIIPKTDGECARLQLTARYNTSKTVDVRWTINETQQNNKQVAYYLIERSADGTNFTEIGRVNATGSANASYSFNDPSPLPGINFYRLRVVYTNGSQDFSSRVRLVDPDSLYKVAVYPNPTSGVFTFEFLVDKDVRMEMQLYDLTGKTVRSFTTTFTDNNLPSEFDLTGLAAGTYILKWSSARSSGQQKIVKL
jgi:hypothetical protein